MAAEESRIQFIAMKILQASGAIVIRMNAGRTRNNVRMAPAGTPDIMAVLKDARVVWVEVKAPGNEPTEVQKDMHDRLRGMGHTVYVVHNIDEIEKMMDEVGGRKEWLEM